MKIIFFLLALCAVSPLPADYLFKNGHFINVKEVAKLPLEMHFQKGLDALKSQDWDTATTQFRIILINFADSSLALDAQYFLGVALYERGELDIANEAFSTYLKKANTPTHLEDVHRYKLSIAQKFAAGQRTHMFGWESMPRWASGKEEALEIFDEVATALPNHELAAVAILGKAELLRDMEQFSNAIDTYQSAIRRFPRSHHALQAFKGIAESYVEAIQVEPQNVDAIALAEINVRECKNHFPQAPEISYVEEKLKQMQEIYAKALFETGQLYERMSEQKASALYYHMSLTKYPSSSVAAACKERLEVLSPQLKELKLHG